MIEWSTLLFQKNALPLADKEPVGNDCNYGKHNSDDIVHNAGLRYRFYNHQECLVCCGKSFKTGKHNFILTQVVTNMNNVSCGQHCRRQIYERKNHSVIINEDVGNSVFQFSVLNNR